MIKIFDDAHVGEVRRLFLARNLNLNSPANTDIPLAMLIGATQWYAVTARWWGASINPTAVQFGIWTGAGGTGAAIMPAGSTLGAMAAPGVTAQGSVGISTLQTAQGLFLRLTTPQGAACTLDGFAIYGVATKNR